jgi:hypothetical protein
MPQGLLPKGLSIVVSFDQNGAPKVGWTHTKSLPIMGSLQEIQRMFSVDNLVGATDALQAKTLQGSAVMLAMLRATKGDPSLVRTGPASQANIASALGLYQAVESNNERLLRNVSKEKWATETRLVLTRAVVGSMRVLSKHIVHETTSGGVKKTLKEIALEEKMPFSLFTKISTSGWIPDSPQLNLVGLLFPKNLGNRITLRIEEWSEGMISFFGELGKTSLFEVELIKQAWTIAGIQRPTALQDSKFQQLTIPLGSPFSLMENLAAKRSGPAPGGLTSDHSRMKAILAIRIQSQCGLAMKNCNADTGWSKITGVNIRLDPNGLSRIDQVMKHLENREDFPVDKAVIEPDNHEFITGLYHGTEWIPLLNENIMATADTEWPSWKAWRAYKPVTVKVSDKGLLQNVTDREKELLSDKRLGLPELKSRKRNYPSGGKMTPDAMEAIMAVRKSRFAGSAGPLGELLTSFSDDILTDQASRLIMASLYRKGEGGILFDTAEVTRNLNVQLALDEDQDEELEMKDFFE